MTKVTRRYNSSSRISAPATREYCQTQDTRRRKRATGKPAAPSRRSSVRSRTTGGWHWHREPSAMQTLETAEPSTRHFAQSMGPHTRYKLRSAQQMDQPYSLTKKTDILNRWAEHYGTLFSDTRSVEDASLDSIQQLPVKHELDEPPSFDEVQTAVRKTNSHKAPGIDGLPAEVYKYGGDQLLEKLTSLFTLCWSKGEVPGDLRDAVIVSLYKNKGEKSDCSNYRGVTLLSIAGKILARVLLDRLIPAIAEEVLPESQCGFRANRGTTDMIFVLRQIQEKCREQNMALYAAFIDLTKAFDTVSREGLWRILGKLGCPPRFLSILQQLHIGQKGQVKHNGEFSDSFPIENGVKQGCVLAPTLFAVFFSMMLQEAKEDLHEGVYIRFRTDGSVFNLRRLLSRTKTLEQLILDLLFVDDCALLAHTEEALQTVVNRFSKAAKAFGLTISLTKTEVLFQKPPREAYTPPLITIDGYQLNAVEHLEVSSPTTQQQPKTLITASQKPAAPLVGYRCACGRTTPCACQPRSRSTGLQSSPPFSTGQKPGSSTESKSNCWNASTRGA